MSELTRQQLQEWLGRIRVNGCTPDEPILAHDQAQREKLDALIDKADLWLDEFQRIKALDVSGEVNAICDRAMQDILRHLPVIYELDVRNTQLLSAQATIQGLEARLLSAKDLIAKQQDLAAMRGQAIMTLTEKWSERRRYYKVALGKVVDIKRELTKSLADAQTTIAELKQQVDDLMHGQEQLVSDNDRLAELVEDHKQEWQQLEERLADVQQERDAWVKRGMLAEKLVDEQQATIAKLEKDWEELNDTADEQLATIQRLEGERDSAQDLKKFYKAEIDRADKLMNDFGIPNIAIECGDMLKPVDERIELVFVQRDTLKQRLATVEAALKESIACHIEGRRPNLIDMQQALAPAPGDHIPDVGKMVCIWSQDGGDDWSTGCGRYFTLNDGQTPEDCAMKFCYHCGKPLEQILEEDITEGTR